jgi:hypothetical protein
MINNVSFCSTRGVFDKPDMTKPQTFTRPATPPTVAPEEAPKKKHSVGKFVAGLAAAALAVGGLLVAGNKTGVIKNLGKYVPDAVKNASWLQAAKEPVKAGLAALDKAGGYIAAKGEGIYNTVKDSSVVKTVVDTVKGWFGKGTPAA